MRKSVEIKRSLSKELGEFKETDDKNKNKYIDKNAIAEESEMDKSSHELNSDSPDVK